MYTRCLLILAEEGGLGTPARPAGCTDAWWRVCWVFTARVIDWFYGHAFPRTGPDSKCGYRFHATFYHIAVTVRRENDPVTTQTGLYLDGQPVQGTSFPLQNDLATHTVELFLQAAPHGLELGPLQAASPPYTAEVYTAQDSPRG
jgi:hypothetical protein